MADPLLTLLDRDGPRLHALLFRLTQRDDVAADLLQELFLRLRDADGFADADQPAAYARRTATNLALAWRRSRRPSATIDTFDAADRSPGPAESAERADDVARVLDAVARLPSEAMRTGFVMRFVEGETYEAIAAAIGKTPHQARGLCHAAVRRVRELVNANVIREVSHE